MSIEPLSMEDILAIRTKAQYPNGVDIFFPNGDSCVLMCGCKVAFGGEIISQQNHPDKSIEVTMIHDSTKGVIYSACTTHGGP